MPQVKIRKHRIQRSESCYVLSLPDMSSHYIKRHKLRGKKALLAMVRCNRLIDMFMQVLAYSRHSDLQTRDPDIKKMEIYVGVNNTGQQFAIPVQAKGGSDQIGIVQVAQDLALCRKAFPLLTPRPVAVQFVPDIVGNKIVMFELVQIDDEVKVIDEKHYRLVPAGDIAPADHKLAAATK